MIPCHACTQNSSRFVPVVGLKSDQIVVLACGAEHSAALTCMCVCGYVCMFEASSSFVVVISSNNQIIMIIMISYLDIFTHTGTGMLYVWGSGSAGQLGSGKTIGVRECMHFHDFMA